MHWLPPGCQHIITLTTLHEGWEGPSAELHLPQGHHNGLRETVGLHLQDLHEARRWPLLPSSPCSLCCTRSPSPYTPALSSHLSPCAHRHTPTLTSLVHRAGTHSTCLDQFPRHTATSLCTPPPHCEPHTHPWHTHSLPLSLTLQQAHTHNAHTCTHMPHMLQASPQPGLTPRTGLRPGKASEDEDTDS